MHPFAIDHRTQQPAAAGNAQAEHPDDLKDVLDHVKALNGDPHEQRGHYPSEVTPHFLRQMDELTA